MKKTDINFNFQVYTSRIKDWYDSNNIVIKLLIVLAIGLKLLSVAPYFNLFLNNHFVIFLVIFFSVLSLQINAFRLILFTLLLFIPVLGFLILGRFEEAELISDYIYVLLLSSTIKGIAQLNRK